MHIVYKIQSRNVEEGGKDSSHCALKGSKAKKLKLCFLLLLF
jgi:hypothetical protein